jgi:hypothetical protein
VQEDPERELEQRYGAAIAGIVATYSVQFAEQAQRVTAQDVKATLLAIVADPVAADLHRLDSLTHTLLMDPAWRRLRLPSLGALTTGQVAECARYALDHFPSVAKATGQAEVNMTTALLAAAGSWHAARRDVLLRAALKRVFRAEDERATAIIKKAQRALRAPAS